MNARTRLAALIVPVFLFQGCLSIVLDQTHVRGQVAHPAPAVVPDSVRPGSLHGSLSVELSDSNARSSVKSPEQTWTRPWVAGGGQLQWVAGPHLRLVAGAQASPTGASWWGGPVLSVRDRFMRWDMELLAGASRLEYEVRGRVVGSNDGDEERDDTLLVQGFGRRVWGQTALRGRAHRSGPWAEWRVAPAVWIATLRDTSHRESLAKDKPVFQTSSSLGGGWIQEFRDGSMVLVGVRSTRMEGATSVSMLVSLQRPIF